MTVSDAIYGKAERYVCRPRLEAMLEHEHRLNLDRLAQSRGETTAFFAFADTVLGAQLPHQSNVKLPDGVRLSCSCMIPMGARSSFTSVQAAIR